MSAADTAELVRHVLMHVCLWSAVALSAVLLVAVSASSVLELFRRARESRAAAVASAFVVLAVMYGGSKGTGPAFRSGVTADGGIGLVGLLTETNSVPDTVVSVYWTNGTVNASVPVSVRNLRTEQWTELVKSDVQFDAVGTTNVMQFVTAGTNWLNAAYWHVGSSKPPIVVTSSDISLTGIVTASDYIRISWTCTDPRCSQFRVLMSEDGAAWTEVGTTGTNRVTCVGFLVGKNRWWKIMSSYLKETE